MKFIKLILVLLITISVFESCSSFGSMNDDPNSAVKVAPSTLLSRAQYRLYDRLHGTNMNTGWGLLMVQHWAENEYTEASRYIFTENSFNTSWEVFYTEVLKELETAKELVDQESIADNIKTNKKNILDIMQVQVYGMLTDCFGDIPYFNVINPEINLPAYDNQQAIYTDLLATLETAALTFDLGYPSFDSGDIVYGGDITKWKKLAHSLMLRLAMRIVDVDASLASQYITTASSDLIEDSSEEALFIFDTTPDRSNPLWIDVVVDSRDDFCVSEFLVESLRDTGDPRLEKFANESPTGGFVGMPYGLLDNAATLLKPTCSRPNNNVRAATSPHVIMSYAEVQFLLAEAYERNILSGNANDAYDEGIRASMTYWGIDDTTAIDDYIASNAYDAGNWKASIGWQKWVALYMNGIEAWSEWRRLDYPVLEVPEAAQVPTVPTKLPYPSSEISNNSEQLGLVTSNPVSITGKVWWDVN